MQENCIRKIYSVVERYSSRSVRFFTNILLRRLVAYGCNYVYTLLNFHFFFFCSSLWTQFLENKNKITNKTYLIEISKAVVRLLLRFIRSTLLCGCLILQVRAFCYSEDLRMISCIWIFENPDVSNNLLWNAVGVLILSCAVTSSYSAGWKSWFRLTEQSVWSDWNRWWFCFRSWEMVSDPLLICLLPVFTLEY